VTLKEKNFNGKAKISNLSITLDIDCHSREIEQKGFLKRMVKDKNPKKIVWDNFDIFQVSEGIARALRTGKFSHIKEFLIDKEYIFFSKKDSRGKGIKEAIKLFGGESELRKRYKEFKFKVVKFDKASEIYCDVLIRRQHSTSTPAVKIKIKGELPTEQAKDIISHLEKNISIKRFETKPALSI
jgi:hypothetical protein